MYVISIYDNIISSHDSFDDAIRNIYNMLYVLAANGLSLDNATKNIVLSTPTKFNIGVRDKMIYLKSESQNPDMIHINRLFPMFNTHADILNQIINAHSLKQSPDQISRQPLKPIPRRPVNPTNVEQSRPIAKVPNKIAQNRTLWLDNKDKPPIKKTEMKFDEQFENKKEAERISRINKFREDERYKRFISAKETYVKFITDIKKGNRTIDDVPPFFLFDFIAIETMDIKKQVSFETDENLPTEYGIYLDLVEILKSDLECENNKCDITMPKQSSHNRIYVPPKWNYMSDAEKGIYAGKYNLTVSDFEKVMSPEGDSDMINTFVRGPKPHPSNQANIVVLNEITHPIKKITDSDADCSETDSDADCSEIESESDDEIFVSAAKLPDFIKNINF